MTIGTISDNTISPAYRRASGQQQGADAPPHPFQPKPESKLESKPSSGDKKLTEEEKQQVEELKKRDAEVRAHEQAHLAAAAGLAQGGPTYVFQTGPDGKQYAVGGHVKIDTSKGRTPEETIQKARQIRSAAMAPSDPSPQDMKVAARAAQLEQEATQDLQKQRQEGDEHPAPSFQITDPRQLAAALVGQGSASQDAPQGNTAAPLA